MEYITEILGIEVTRVEWEQAKTLPYFLQNKYSFESVKLGDTKCIFIKPISELETINVIKKHLKRLREICDWLVVFELDAITRQRRASFIEAKVAFVVPDKQIYLPFIGVHLQERCDRDEAITPVLEKLQPSAQMLLFAFIIGKNKPMYLSEMTKRFHFSAMTISRAANQLTQTGLISKRNDRVQKLLVSELTPQELYRKLKPYLINPVRKTIYISRTEITAEMFHAGLSALADRSMLNPPMPEVWGMVQSEKLISNAGAHLIDAEKQCALELWKYDPRLICGDGKADALSLSFSLKDITDERVEQMLNDMLNKVW